MSNLTNRRNFFAISAGLGLAAAFASTTHATALNTSSLRRAELSQDIDWNLERQFAELAEDLSQLPDWLLKADPASTPNYVSVVEKELSKINSGRSLHIQTRPTPSPGVIAPQGAGECAVAVLPILAGIGFPLFRIVQVIRAAIRSWGSIRMAVSAIRRGAHLHEIGEDGVKILEELLAIGGAYSACRGLLG
ncbi:hypothetical protein [Rothia endophytica]|uniref:hypothetical protein n=1 Tax=Rothia endophytica TaxID=1324766 RepID=UPI001F44928C|nr:hypothetical protein [Rothia endophytica]